MWNSDKSVKLSLICTKLVIILTFIFAIGAHYFVGQYIYYAEKTIEIYQPLMLTIYTCCVPALGALFCLNGLLKNIGKEKVFVEINVKHLRIISWCCFAVALILLLSGFYYIFFIMLSIISAFIGLILRVVKNVIAQAILIKDENDYTI